MQSERFSMLIPSGSGSPDPHCAIGIQESGIVFWQDEISTPAELDGIIEFIVGKYSPSGAERHGSSCFFTFENDPERIMLLTLHNSSNGQSFIYGEAHTAYVDADFHIFILDLIQSLAEETKGYFNVSDSTGYLSSLSYDGLLTYIESVKRRADDMIKAYAESMERIEKIKRSSAAFSMKLSDFAEYAKNVRYGYMDSAGTLHFADEANFEIKNYTFSLPEDIEKNNCAWCWDMANLIYMYCKFNRLPAQLVFMEYESESLHQTHTQCFACIKDKWLAFPDNSSPYTLRTVPKFEDPERAIEDLTSQFTAYIKRLSEGSFDPERIFVNRLDDAVAAHMSDEEYLEYARQK